MDAWKFPEGIRESTNQVLNNAMKHRLRPEFPFVVSLSNHAFSGKLQLV